MAFSALRCVIMNSIFAASQDWLAGSHLRQERGDADGIFDSISPLSNFERGDIEGKAGRRRRIEEENVEAGEEEAGLRRVKMRSGMIGGILTASLSLSLSVGRQ